MILLRYLTCYILFLNLYAEVMGDLKYLSWGQERNEKESLLEKFLMDAEIYLIQNCSSRHTTIVAPNNQLLNAATPIFKGRPYFVGTDTKVIVQSREYENENCVFVFIDTVDYDYLSMIFSHLPRNYKIKVQIVSTSNLLNDKVKNTLDLAYDKSIENVIITFLDNNEFKAFQIFPFTRNCMREIRPSYVWDPDKGFKTYNYDDHSPRNLNKCPVPISTLPLEESTTVHENDDGTLDILGGHEGNLILTFAEKLNFTAIVKYPQIQDYERIVNNTIGGLVGDIANRRSLIVIGNLAPSLKRLEYSDFTTNYDYACIVWTTPAIKFFTKNVLYSEFQIYLWLIFILSIIFSCAFIYILYRIRSNNRERQTCIGVTLDVICATLGWPVHRLPTNRPGKVYILSFIFYAMVVITAYGTYLSSILIVRKEEQLIKTNADIVRSKLITGGFTYILSVLQSQREESPYMPYLIDHYHEFVKIATATNTIKYGKNYAIAKDRSEVDYYKRNLILSGKEVHFYSFDKCILLYHEVVLVRKGSVLTIELNDIITRLREAGLLNFWKNERTNIDIQKAHEPVKLQKLKLGQLKSVFIFYLSGMLLSGLVMLLEIMFGVLSKKKKSKSWT